LSLYFSLLRVLFLICSTNVGKGNSDKSWISLSCTGDFALKINISISYVFEPYIPQKKIFLPAQFLPFLQNFFISLNFCPNKHLSFQTFWQTFIDCLLLKPSWRLGWVFGGWFRAKKFIQRSDKRFRHQKEGMLLPDFLHQYFQSCRNWKF